MSTRIKWNPCDEPMAHQISGVTFIPGFVYPFPIDALQESIQLRMPGLNEGYISGYVNPQATIDPTISGLGEIAIIRKDGDLAKTYNFAFAKKEGGQIFFAGPFKDFPEHHWQSTEPVPIEKIFGNSPISP